MKLDMDLFRDILLFLEDKKYYIENTDGKILNVPVNIEDIYQQFPNYPKANIFYTLKNMNEAGYINATIVHLDDSLYVCVVNYITFNGHNFLNSVKSEERWSGIKKALPHIRDFSLEAIKSISQGMTTAAINAYLQKNL